MAEMAMTHIYSFPKPKCPFDSHLVQRLKKYAKITSRR